MIFLCAFSASCSSSSLSFCPACVHCLPKDCYERWNKLYHVTSLKGTGKASGNILWFIFAPFPTHHLVLSACLSVWLALLTGCCERLYIKRVISSSLWAPFFLSLFTFMCSCVLAVSYCELSPFLQLFSKGCHEEELKVCSPSSLWSMEEARVSIAFLSFAFFAFIRVPKFLL